jgi:hypothetical protein
MVPLDSDAVRRDADDRVPILEVHPVEHGRSPQIPPLRPLDPRRIRRALQRHDHLLARLFGDEHGRDIRCGARTDQRALLLSLSESPVMFNGILMYYY